MYANENFTIKNKVVSRVRKTLWPIKVYIYLLLLILGFNIMCNVFCNSVILTVLLLFRHTI